MDKKFLFIIIFFSVSILLLNLTTVRAAMFITPESIRSVYGHKLNFVADNNSHSSYYIDKEGGVCNHKDIKDKNCQNSKGIVYIQTADEKTCLYADFGANKCSEEFYKTKRCIKEGEHIWPYLGQKCCQDLELKSQQSVLGISKFDGNDLCVRKMNFFQKLWNDINFLISSFI